MYWKKAKKNAQSMMNLGWPHLFLTIDCNDLHWIDVFHAMDPSHFRTNEDVENLTGSERVGHDVHQSPRCVTKPGSSGDALTSKYATLALFVPFGQEMADLLQVEDDAEVTEEVVVWAIVRFRSHLVSCRIGSSALQQLNEAALGILRANVRLDTLTLPDHDADVSGTVYSEGVDMKAPAEHTVQSAQATAPSLAVELALSSAYTVEMIANLTAKQQVAVDCVRRYHDKEFLHTIAREAASKWPPSTVTPQRIQRVTEHTKKRRGLKTLS